MGVFIRTIMIITIVGLLLLDLSVVLLAKGHDMEHCKTSLMQKGYSPEKVQEGCQFPQDLVDNRYIIYGISATLILAAAITFIAKGD